jgi:hypothetical protein
MSDLERFQGATHEELMIARYVRQVLTAQPAPARKAQQ